MLHLRVISGSEKGRTIPLNESNLPVRIGRDGQNTVALELSAISRFHCQIIGESEGYYVEDLGSTNGTFLNGRRISRERVRPGDEIIVANIGMVIEAQPISIHESSSPLEAKVSIDAQPKDRASLTLSDSTESIGSHNFLENLDKDENERSYEALKVLYKADHAFRNIEDVNVVLESLLDLVMESIPASRGYVFLLQRDTGNLVPYVRRPEQEEVENAEIVVSQTIVQTAVREKSSIISSDALVDDRFLHSRSIVDLAIRSAMCAPLINRGTVLGIIYIDSTNQTNLFSRQDLALFSALALKAGTAVDNARLYDDLRSLFYNTVETLVRTIQAKDPYTSGHSTRVSRYSLLIADKLNLTTKEKHQLYLAAMLHDIGKIGVPDELLNRPGKLTDDEMNIVRNHVQLGASMIEMLGEMHPIVPLIRHHHEGYDGTGYPDGLKGEEIPLISRIVAVADMYDAMTSDRSYRKRRTQEYAISEIKRTRGTKLDPRVCDAFLEVLREISHHVPSEISPTVSVPTELPTH